MEKKYHISNSGKIVECKAEKVPCKKQFSSVEEAESYLNSHHSPVISSNTSSERKRNKNSSKNSPSLQSMKKTYGTDNIFPYKMNVDHNTEKLIDELYSIGNPLIVGGAVRDSIVGKKSKDIDIEVHGTTMEKISKTLKNKGYRVDEVGRQFGVLKVTGKGLDETDVSIPRIESKTGSSHRSFKTDFSSEMTVSEAAERRDFTFNAIMYDHLNKVLVDPTGGLKDLKTRTIRHVSEKFSEDPLRVMRAVQFSTRFGMTIDDETAHLCRTLRKDANTLSVERMREEWGKFFEKGSNHRLGISTMQKSGWDDISPGLRESLSNDKTLDALEQIGKTDLKNKPILSSAVIAKNMNDSDALKYLNTSLMSVKESKKSYALSRSFNLPMSSSYERKKSARLLGEKGINFNMVYDLAKSENDKETMEKAAKAKLEGIGFGPEEDLVMGRDLIKLTDRKPGPWMSKAISEIRDMQYREGWKDKDSAIDYAKTVIEKI